MESYLEKPFAKDIIPWQRFNQLSVPGDCLTVLGFNILFRSHFFIPKIAGTQSDQYIGRVFLFYLFEVTF